MPPREYVEISVTCKGDIDDPRLGVQLQSISNNLESILHTGKNHVRISKVERWNSVRVTLALPREAALRLKRLAEEGNERLAQLGILSVQVKGNQWISLTFASTPKELARGPPVPSSPSTSWVLRNNGVNCSPAQPLPGAAKTAQPLLNPLQGQAATTRMPTATILSQDGLQFKLEKGMSAFSSAISFDPAQLAALPPEAAAAVQGRLSALSAEGAGPSGAPADGGFPLSARLLHLLQSELTGEILAEAHRHHVQMQLGVPDAAPAPAAARKRRRSPRADGEAGSKPRRPRKQPAKPPGPEPPMLAPAPAPPLPAVDGNIVNPPYTTLSKSLPRPEQASTEQETTTTTIPTAAPTPAATATPAGVSLPNEPSSSDAAPLPNGASPPSEPSLPNGASPPSGPSLPNGPTLANGPSSLANGAWSSPNSDPQRARGTEPLPYETPPDSSSANSGSGSDPAFDGSPSPSPPAETNPLSPKSAGNEAFPKRNGMLEPPHWIRGPPRQVTIYQQREAARLEGALQPSGLTRAVQLWVPKGSGSPSPPDVDLDRHSGLKEEAIENMDCGSPPPLSGSNSQSSVPTPPYPDEGLGHPEDRTTVTDAESVLLHSPASDPMLADDGGAFDEQQAVTENGHMDHSSSFAATMLSDPSFVVESLEDGESHALDCGFSVGESCDKECEAIAIDYMKPSRGMDESHFTSLSVESSHKKLKLDNLFDSFEFQLASLSPEEDSGTTTATVLVVRRSPVGEQEEPATEENRRLLRTRLPSATHKGEIVVDEKPSGDRRITRSRGPAAGSYSLPSRPADAPIDLPEQAETLPAFRRTSKR